MLQIQVLIKRSVLIVALIVGKVGLAQITEVEGNVGIGTNTPEAKLDVNGSSKFSGDITIEGMLNSKIAIKEYANQEFYNFGGTKTVKIEGDIDGGGRIGIQSGNNASDFSSVYLYADGAAESQGIIVKKFRIDNSSAVGAALLSSRFDGDTEAITGLELNTTNSVVVVGDKIDYEKNKGYGLINKFKTKFENDLHLYGSVRGNIGGGALRVKSDHGQIDIGAQNTSWAHIYTDRPKVIFNTPVYSIKNTFSSYDDDLKLQTKGLTRLSINDDTGNVGIGVSNPDEKLHVNGTATVIGNIGTITDRSHYHTGAHTLELQNGDAGDVVLSFHRGGYTNAAIKHSSLGGLIFSASGRHNQNDMFIKANGLVGIGTTNPDSKLSVNGNIHTKEVKVDLVGWSDFVFYKDYKLPTLEAVEAHIKEKGHLKDIPSAAEVKAEGILLGEMNAKLLQKIEELTLYTIEQDKQIKSQRAINAVLESRLVKLEQALLKQE